MSEFFKFEIIPRLGWSVAAVSVIFVIMSRRKRMQRAFFAWLYSRYIAAGMAKALKSHKENLFASLGRTISSDPLLRAQGQGVIRVLEIGIGTGINLEFYPRGCRLITVEPNEHFKTYFEKNREKFDHVQLEVSVLGSAENMSEIADNSVDVVVSTCVLCSVAKMKEALKEIVRVLTPGGKFYYVEHVAYKDSTWSRRVQRVMEPLWSFAFDACKLTSPTSESIATCGFKEIQEKLVDIDDLFYLIKPNIIGIATK